MLKNEKNVQVENIFCRSSVFRSVRIVYDMPLKMHLSVRLSYLPPLPPPLPSEVWLGEYKGVKIAIKMLKDIKDAKATKQFLAEASIMT